MMLFSERYNNLIETSDSFYENSFLEDIDIRVKKKIAKVMYDFEEPITIHPNRYDQEYTEKTNALEVAVSIFNDDNKSSYGIMLQNEYIGVDDIDPLVTTYLPYLFDVIELQYEALSDSEKVDYQSDINKVFSENEIPWLLHDGRLIKIDSSQFEQDLKRNALDKMTVLKDAEPVFQSAYDEFVSAIDAIGREEYDEAVNYAEKSYESVLKIICDINKGNADALTQKLVDEIHLNLPDSITGGGFKDNVLMALPYIRNHSSGHGAGMDNNEIDQSLANLAVSMAAALDTYLIEEYRKDI